MGVGLAVFKWPILFADKLWGLAQGTVEFIPWRHVLTHYVLTPGQPWRRSRSA